MKVCVLVLMLVAMAGCSGAQKQMAGWGFTAAGGTAALYTIGMVAAVGENYSDEVLGAQLGVSGAALIIGIICLATGGPSEAEVREQNKPVYHRTGDDRPVHYRTNTQMERQRMWDARQKWEREKARRKHEQARKRYYEKHKKPVIPAKPASQPTIPPVPQVEDSE